MKGNTMMFMEFVKQGLSFTYSADAMVPEIPYIQDVLYALRLSDEQHAYDFCLANHAPYIQNVHLAAAAVVNDILGMEVCEESAVQTIIAKAIVELCPRAARHKFCQAFVLAEAMCGKTQAGKGRHDSSWPVATDSQDFPSIE